MSFDPSKILYPHFICGELPCTCTYDHKPLEFTLLQCRVPSCRHTFMSETERGNHHLDNHEIPFMVPGDEVAIVQHGNGVHHV